MREEFYSNWTCLLAGIPITALTERQWAFSEVTHHFQLSSSRSNFVEFLALQGSANSNLITS